jgi:hypothetical protein
VRCDGYGFDGGGELFESVDGVLKQTASQPEGAQRLNLSANGFRGGERGNGADGGGERITADAQNRQSNWHG